MNAFDKLTTVNQKKNASLLSLNSGLNNNSLCAPYLQVIDLYIKLLRLYSLIDMTAKNEKNSSIIESSIIDKIPFVNQLRHLIFYFDPNC